MADSQNGLFERLHRERTVVSGDFFIECLAQKFETHCSQHAFPIDTDTYMYICIM